MANPQPAVLDRVMGKNQWYVHLSRTEGADLNVIKQVLRDTRAHCDAEGREVLLTTRRITAIEMLDGVNHVHFTCWCGHEGVLVDAAVARPAQRVPAVPGRAA